MKEKINELKNKFLNFYNYEKPLKFEYIIAILIALVMLFLYAYNDLKSLTIWSTNMLDVLFEMDISNYFAYTAENIYNAPHQYVSGTLYNFIPWAVWNIPIWIIQRFVGIPILTTPLLLVWSKLFLVACLGVTLYYAYKIVMLLTNDKSKSIWCVFLSGTFFYTYVGVFYAGQTCIQICLFGTLAIYMLLKQKDNLFLLFSALAVSTKYFFLFPFIAIILLLEKDVFKIIKKLFLVILPILIFSLLCHNMPMYAESSNANPFFVMLSGLINSSIPIMNGNKLSLFIFSQIIIYFVAYITVPKDEKEKNHYIIYFTVASILTLFMFTNFQFYRMILVIPFVYILFSLNPKSFKLNIILDTVMCVFSAIMMTFSDITYFFSTEHSMPNGILGQILNLEQISNITIGRLITSATGRSMILSISSTVSLAAMIIILVINNPKFKLKNMYYNEKMDRWLIWIRLLLIVPYILFTVFAIL